MTIYSSLLYQKKALVASSAVTCFTVVSPDVIVVRDIDFYNDTNISTSSHAALNGIRFTDDLAIEFAGVWCPDAMTTRFYHWRGRQVFTAGMALKVQTFDVNWSVRVSGYLFTS